MGFYDSKENMVYRMLQQYGRDYEIYHETDAGVDIATGEDISNKLTTVVRGIETTYSDILTGADTGISKGDKDIIIDARSGKPKIGDNVLSEENLHRIISIKPTNPAGTPLMYEIHVRTYELTDEVDTLTIKLKDLPAGSVVEDTTEDQAQDWRVIAHNHFTPGYTTLILDSIFDIELIPFNGSGYPAKPWNATWMHRYLLNTFKRYLSAELIELIQPVIIETDGLDSSDTIYLLSKEEMGGTAILGLAAGELIAYFDLASKRLATYDGANTTYWTRNTSWGVSADGQFTTLNPYNTYGVRPVINIRQTIDTALNLEGKYEIQF